MDLSDPPPLPPQWILTANLSPAHIRLFACWTRDHLYTLPPPLPPHLLCMCVRIFFFYPPGWWMKIYRIGLSEAPLPIERYISNFVCEVPLPPQGQVRTRARL